jgi:uncharacterized short protein YbdD (DUF466 family)
MDVLRRSSDAVRWYVGAMMGDSDYQRYLAHHRAHHPTDVPMTERDYWRTRYRDQDRNPQGRCC